MNPPCPLGCPVTPPHSATGQPLNKIGKEISVPYTEDVFPWPVADLRHSVWLLDMLSTPPSTRTDFSLHRFNFCSQETVRENVLLTLSLC